MCQLKSHFIQIVKPYFFIILYWAYKYLTDVTMRLHDVNPVNLSPVIDC